MSHSLNIPLDNEIVKFRNHLEHNKRIVFSARFGDGKTTFLREFQKAEGQKDCYFLTIHPVNYSVATNEDIFEYIKRDVLYQLHKDGWLNEIDLDAIFDNILTWDFFQPLVSFLLSFVPGGAFLQNYLIKQSPSKMSTMNERAHGRNILIHLQTNAEACMRMMVTPR